MSHLIHVYQGHHAWLVRQGDHFLNFLKVWIPAGVIVKVAQDQAILLDRDHVQECAGLDAVDEECVLVGVPAIADKVSIPGGDDKVPELLGEGGCAADWGGGQHVVLGRKGRGGSAEEMVLRGLARAASWTTTPARLLHTAGREKTKAKAPPPAISTQPPLPSRTFPLPRP